MSKGKKKAFTLIGLCALMAVAIGLYVWLPKGESEDTEDADTSEGTVQVAKINKDDICAVTIAGSGREEISLVKQGEEWKLSDLPEAAVLSETVEGMFTNVNPVMATKALGTGESSEYGTEVAELSDYGLDEPALSVTLKMSDGKEHAFTFGGEVPTTGGRYGLYEGSGQVYAFAAAIYNAFDVEKNSLIEKEEIADINEDYLTSISVRADGKKDFYAEIVPDDKKVDAYTNWVISKPYKKPLAGSSTDDWSKLQGFFTSVRFDELVEYDCKDFGKYGLDKPLATVEVHYFETKDGYVAPEETAAPNDGGVSRSNTNTNKANTVPDEYKDKKSYELLFGTTDEEGNPYVCFKGSRQVYTMAAASADNMLDVDAYTYMDHCVYSTLATDINGYDVTFADGRKMSVTRTAKKGEDGKDQNVWTLDGRTVPEDQQEEFLSPYSKMFLLEYTSEAKDDVKAESSKPVLSVVFHEEGRDVAVKYLPYDGTNFYRVDKDGMDYFLADKRSVDAVITAFESLSELSQSIE